MTLNWHSAGLFNVGSHQVTGVPYMTGSTLLAASFGNNNAQQRLDFPYVTKEIRVTNKSDQAIRVHFNDLTSGRVEAGLHYATIPSASNSSTFKVMAKQMWVSLADGSANAVFEVAAELTVIPSKHMAALTGSGLTD